MIWNRARLRQQQTPRRRTDVGPVGPDAEIVARIRATDDRARFTICTNERHMVWEQETDDHTGDAGEYRGSHPTWQEAAAAALADVPVGADREGWSYHIRCDCYLNYCYRFEGAPRIHIATCVGKRCVP